MKEEKHINLPNLAALGHLAEQLATRIPPASWVYLQGDLGSGKTAFSQRFIAAKGCAERVTSPTYALMQDYETPSGTVIHCDLYRLAEPEELYEIGLLEMADSRRAIVLIEWPDKGLGVLPPPDFTLAFALADHPLAGYRLADSRGTDNTADERSEYRQLTLTEH